MHNNLSFYRQIDVRKHSFDYNLTFKDKYISQLFQKLDKNRRTKEAESGSISISQTETEPETGDSELWIQLALMLDRIGLFVFTFTLSVGCAYIFMGINSK